MSPSHPVATYPDPEDVPSEPQTSRGKIGKFGESMVLLINAADENISLYCLLMVYFNSPPRFRIQIE